MPPLLLHLVSNQTVDSFFHFCITTCRLLYVSVRYVLPGAAAASLCACAHLIKCKCRTPCSIYEHQPSLQERISESIKNSPITQETLVHHVPRSNTCWPSCRRADRRHRCSIGTDAISGVHFDKWAASSSNHSRYCSLLACMTQGARRLTLRNGGRVPTAEAFRRTVGSTAGCAVTAYAIARLVSFSILYSGNE